MSNIAKIFVIIVTYKGHRWYDRCFSSLRASELPVQTVVIDNASNDGTVEYIRECFPEIHVIESKVNLGFGRANNIGMRYALEQGCDYVFLLNQDAWISSNTLSVLLQVHYKYPKYGVLTPMHINADKTHLNILLDDGKNNYEMLSDLYFSNLQDVYTITYANAAAWLLSRKTLETIGGFCPFIYHYGEDDDYMNRLIYHQIPMGIVPTVSIIHDSTCRMGESKVLATKAAREGVYQMININNTQEPISLLIYYIRKWFINILRANVNSRKYCAEKIIYIYSNFKVLNSVRKLHRTKDVHWLYYDSDKIEY